MNFNFQKFDSIDWTKNCETAITDLQINNFYEILGGRVVSRHNKAHIQVVLKSLPQECYPMLTVLLPTPFAGIVFSRFKKSLMYNGLSHDGLGYKISFAGITQLTSVFSRHTWDAPETPETSESPQEMLQITEIPADGAEITKDIEKTHQKDASIPEYSSETHEITECVNEDATESSVSMSDLDLISEDNYSSVSEYSTTSTRHDSETPSQSDYEKNCIGSLKELSPEDNQLLFEEYILSLGVAKH